MSVDVDLLIVEVAHCVVVPNDAVVRENGKSYVYVVREGTAHKQPVRIGQKNDTQSIVSSGLHLGDVVVAEKPAAITDGTAVAALPSASPSPK
ncbi:MAG: hypothetical protein NVS9B12_01420 [Vulcanimicrobiaceae bacterium]